jgi:hypothetical protein
MRFSCYDFNVVMPNEWKVAIDKKSQYDKGIISFSTPKGNTLDIVWENLERYKVKAPSVEAFINSYFDDMKKNRNVKSLDYKKGFFVAADEHETLPHEFTYEYKPVLGRGVTMKIVGLSMYCLHSNRFVVMYSKMDPKKENPDEAAVREAIGTFNCSCNKNAKL